VSPSNEKATLQGSLLVVGQFQTDPLLSFRFASKGIKQRVLP
jgi:hypothetical protein